MLSDITFKYVAIAELAMYDKLNALARTYSSVIVVPATTLVCVADVFMDTVKYPIAALENGVFSAINFCGSCCFENCDYADSLQNVKKAAAGAFVATPVMTILSPFKLFSQLCVALPDPVHAKPSNREADKEAQLKAIIM
jgi:hypothetical protein